MATSSPPDDSTNCLMCECGDLKAKAFELTRKTVEDYKKNFTEEWNDSSLPPLNTFLKWTVYKLSASRRYGHQSLLFVPDGTQYESAQGFTIELRTDNTVHPFTAILPSTKADSLPKLGTVEQSAEALMAAGLKCLADFGDYHKVTNNCQNYVRQLAKELDIKVPWTDIAKAAVESVVGVGVGLSLLAIGAAAAVGIGLAVAGDRKSSEED